MATDVLLVQNSCLVLARRDTSFCKRTESTEAEARALADRVHDLEGQAKGLQTELAGSRTMAVDLENRGEELEAALEKKREEVDRLKEERAHSAFEVARLEG